MNESLGSRGFKGGLELINPNYYKTSYALRFNFKVLNNKANYEVLITSLNLAQKLGVEAIEVFGDSMLIVNKVTMAFQDREERMAKYLRKVKFLLDQFKRHIVTQIPRFENIEANALAQLASGIDMEGLIFVPMKCLYQPSIKRNDRYFVLRKSKFRWPRS